MRYRTVQTPVITTGAALRKWLLRHEVNGLDAEYDPRRIEGRTLSGKTATSIMVTAAAMRELDGEVVWCHHPDGGSLPASTLFALRQQLPTTGVHSHGDR